MCISKYSIINQLIKAIIWNQYKKDQIQDQNFLTLYTISDFSYANQCFHDNNGIKLTDIG